MSTKISFLRPVEEVLRLIGFITAALEIVFLLITPPAPAPALATRLASTATGSLCTYILSVSVDVLCGSP
jgi:hypothetical protein